MDNSHQDSEALEWFWHGSQTTTWHSLQSDRRIWPLAGFAFLEHYFIQTQVTNDQTRATICAYCNTQDSFNRSPKCKPAQIPNPNWSTENNYDLHAKIIYKWFDAYHSKYCSSMSEVIKMTILQLTNFPTKCSSIFDVTNEPAKISLCSWPIPNYTPCSQQPTHTSTSTTKLLWDRYLTTSGNHIFSQPIKLTWWVNFSGKKAFPTKLNGKPWNMQCKNLPNWITFQFKKLSMNGHQHKFYQTITWTKVINCACHATTNWNSQYIYYSAQPIHA